LSAGRRNSDAITWQETTVVPGYKKAGNGDEDDGFDMKGGVGLKGRICTYNVVVDEE